VDADLWKDLLADPRLPLMNRAIAAEYAPGSTLKPVVAAAGLVNGRLRADSGADCPGYHMVGTREIRCASRWGHGWLDLAQSLEKSCNVFYCRHGTQIGPDTIAHMAEAMGLGRRTGLELAGERPGLVPTPAWKLRRERDAWREGDTCNLSIGQGYILVTPLQMAVVTAAFANGGRVLRPRLVRGVRAPGDEAFEMRGPVTVNDLHWNAARFEPIRAGMRAVIMSDEGSGRAARVPGLVAAGKTGTAEFGPRDARRKHVWMIAYAPADRPRYACALVVDEGLSGGETAAPKLRTILAGLFPPPAEPAAAPEGAG
jgi:penicillin-binding protein 2